MKTNAIIRIITWSLVIVILLGILTAGLGIGKTLPQKIISSSPLETAVPQRITEPTIPQGIEETHVPQRIEVTIPEETDIALPSSYTVTVTTNVRSEPDYTAQVLGAVDAGQVINPIQGKKINGHHWAYIEAPVQGWILLTDNVEETVPPMEATIPAATPSAGEAAPDAGSAAANLPGANAVSIDAAQIRELDIEWAAGEITISPYQGTDIQIQESGDTEKYPMVVKQDRSELTIRYSKQNKISFGINEDYRKNLTILVPESWYCQELEIQAASATVLIQELNAGEVNFEGASGQCQFLNCTVTSMDIDTASGDIFFSGTLNTLECDAASANFTGVLANVPRVLEMESMSGNLDVTLPASAGFTVSMEGMNSAFRSDFDISCASSHHSYSHSSCKTKVHTHGDGACRISMEALSGEVIIRKGN